ncbi:MAG: hypothetical protein CMO55_25540 [Verrucomicrobiales bacterium]|nr:hypothetical protein [Verrucomicrobiales bacterium]
MSETTSRDHGPQPLDTLLDELGISNNDLVGASTEQLTHKQVQKARKGRQVTPNIQGKILKALNDILREQGAERLYLNRDLFSY